MRRLQPYRYQFSIHRSRDSCCEIEAVSSARSRQTTTQMTAVTEETVILTPKDECVVKEINHFPPDKHDVMRDIVAQV